MALLQANNSMRKTFMVRILCTYWLNGLNGVTCVFVYLLQIINHVCSFNLDVNGLPSELRIFPRALSPAFFLALRLLFLAVLELGAPLSSFLEETQYKC